MFHSNSKQIAVLFACLAFSAAWLSPAAENAAAAEKELIPPPQVWLDTEKTPDNDSSEHKTISPPQVWLDTESTSEPEGESEASGWFKPKSYGVSF